MGTHEDLMAGDDILSPSSVNIFGANIEGVEAAAPEEDAVKVTPAAELAALGRVHKRVIVLEGESQKAKDQLEEAKKKPAGVSCQVLHALVVWAFLLGAFLMAAYAVSQISSQPTYETTVTGTWVGNATAVSTSGVSASSVTAVLSTDTDGVVTGTIGNAVIGMVGSDANSSPPGEISLVETGYMDEHDHWVSGRQQSAVSDAVSNRDNTHRVEDEALLHSNRCSKRFRRDVDSRFSRDRLLRSRHWSVPFCNLQSEA